MLKSLPQLHFDEHKHRYAYRGTWLQNSVTRVIDDLDDAARAQIAATKDGPDGWAARGNSVHAALENFLLYKAGETKDGIVMDEKWSEWIDPMLDHWLWDGCIVEAVELRLCDPKKSLGGSLDFIISDKDGNRVLGDLKTVKTAKAADLRKPADKQLGGYLQMLLDSHRFYVDKCVTLIASPGKTVIKTSKPDDCLAAWLDAWMKFDARTPDI
jgi:hypothetical protein